MNEIYNFANKSAISLMSVQVQEGWHSVLVDELVWNDYIGTYDYLAYFTDGYGNGANRPVYGNTRITAAYYP